MAVQQLIRYSVAICAATLLSACSWGSHGDSSRSDECKWNRSKCMYEGAYEPGEKDYAEQEAKRMNQAESKRMRKW